MVEVEEKKYKEESRKMLELITDARLQKKWSVYKLAQESNMAEQNLRRALNSQEITYNLFKKLAAAMQLQINIFLTPINSNKSLKE